jgi:hypothetical protein
VLSHLLAFDAHNGMRSDAVQFDPDAALRDLLRGDLRKLAAVDRRAIEVLAEHLFPAVTWRYGQRPSTRNRFDGPARLQRIFLDGILRRWFCWDWLKSGAVLGQPSNRQDDDPD